MLTNSQKKANKKQGVGTLTYYCYEALDCPD